MEVQSRPYNELLRILITKTHQQCILVHQLTSMEKGDYWLGHVEVQEQ